jgi:hypothetical protein
MGEMVHEMDAVQSEKEGQCSNLAAGKEQLHIARSFVRSAVLVFEEDIHVFQERLCSPDGLARMMVIPMRCRVEDEGVTKGEDWGSEWM